MTHTREKKLTLLNFDQKDKIEALEGEISNLEARTALTRAAAEKAKASLQKSRVEAAETLEYQKTKEQEYTNNFDQITEDERKRLEKLIAVEITKYNTLRKESANFNDQIDSLKLTVPELESQFLEEQSKTLERFVEENQGVFSTLELVYERANGFHESKTQYDSNMKKTIHQLRKVKPTRSLELAISDKEFPPLNFFKSSSQNLKKVDKWYSEVLQNLLSDYDWSQFDEYCESLSPIINELYILGKDEQEWHSERKQIDTELKKENQFLADIEKSRRTPDRKRASPIMKEYIHRKLNEFMPGVPIGLWIFLDSEKKPKLYFAELNEYNKPLDSKRISPFIEEDCPFGELIDIEKKYGENYKKKLATDSKYNDLCISASIEQERERRQQTLEEWFVTSELTGIIHQRLDEETYTQLRESYLAMKEKESIPISYIKNLDYGGNTQ